MTSSTPDSSIANGQFSSMKLDSTGNPVISHYDSANGQLRLTRCYDPACAIAHTNVVDGDGTGEVGQHTSLQLDSDDFAVISYYDAVTGDLKLAHCDDLDCSVNVAVSTVDATSDRGQYSSLALDDTGNPIISYYDVISGDLLLAHCNDRNCEGGNDAPAGPINTNDGGDDVGSYSSLALDLFDQFPTIAYQNVTDGDVKVVHCNDAACAGSEPGAVVDGVNDVGANLSMALDLGSNPVIAYYDADFLALKVARCDTSTCDAPVVNIALDGFTSPIDTSIALDANDFAVVSYIDNSNTLAGEAFMRVARCLDLDCTAVDSATPDPVDGELPANTSIVLDVYGNPTISRFDSTFAKLIVVHCTDPMCTPHVRLIAAP